VRCSVSDSCVLFIKCVPVVLRTTTKETSALILHISAIIIHGCGVRITANGVGGYLEVGDNWEGGWKMLKRGWTG